MTTPLVAPEIRSLLRKNTEQRALSAKRYAYYHHDDLRFFLSMIQETSRVLIIGCDVMHLAGQIRTGETQIVDLLDEGVDLPHVLHTTPFDYVLLPYTLHFLENIQEFLEVLRAGLSPQARVVALQYNFFWAPLYKVAERIGLKAPMPSLNWLSTQDIENLFQLTRFEPVQSGSRCLVPFGVLGLGQIINTYLAPLPFIRKLNHKSFAVSRPGQIREKTASTYTVTIVVPARNEAGNIGPLLDRLPKLGEMTEVMFIEGHSRDHTWQEIQKQIQNHPRRGEFSLKAFQQTGVGKADAVRLGFSKASGDLLIILDADLSVRPEDLPLFYHAISDGVAEFVNGSRLVYNMESQAMQLLNLFFNKLFGVWLSWMIGQPIKDTLCGTKVLLRKDYLRIQKAFPHWAGRDPFGDFELILGAAKLNLKIRDLPVAYKQRTYGSTNISRFRHGWQLLKMCLAFWPEFKR
jgi:hypothetical protein